MLPVPASKLQAIRLDRGMIQQEVVDEIYRRAVARGDDPLPGLCPVAVSRHENLRKRPGPYYQAWYCEVLKATPAELGFDLARPDESDHHEDVDRREFLTGVAGFMVTLALPPTRLGSSDIVSLRESLAHLYKLDDLHGTGSVYTATARTFQRLHRFEREPFPTSRAAARSLDGLGRVRIVPVVELERWLHLNGRFADDE